MDEERAAASAATAGVKGVTGKDDAYEAGDGVLAIPCTVCRRCEEGVADAADSSLLT